MKNLPKKEDVKVACDIEVSPNAFLIGFKRIDNGRVVQYSLYGENKTFNTNEKRKIHSILEKYTIVTFNGKFYDIPIILRSLKDGVSVNDLFHMSSEMINDNMNWWSVGEKWNVHKPFWLKHIDIMPPTFGRQSLKMYGARIHSKKLQELPYEWNKILTESEFEEIKKYNVNDLDTTIDLFHYIQNEIDIRYDLSRQFKVDVMSLNDSKLAETIICNTLKSKGCNISRLEINDDYCVYYNPPSALNFENEKLKELLNRVKRNAFGVNKKGEIDLPEFIKEPIKIGETEYKFGVGGLHSKDKKLVVEANEKEFLYNIDVTSYYPSMILTYGIYPKRYGKAFLKVYDYFYKARVEAKSKGNDSITKAYKPILNHTYGNFGSKYSKIYDPSCMLNVTLTGQLLLLMLVERLEDQGFRVISANTDGLEILADRLRKDTLDWIITEWEFDTGMNMERCEYKALYARDVNAYVAIYDGYTKSKSIFGDPDISKNLKYPIVGKAIRDYLLNEKPMSETINECNDVRQFISTKNVNGKGQWRGQILGKVVRFYYSKDGDPITYVTNGNKVGDSDRSRPIMNLPENNIVPDDLDKDYYISICKKQYETLGLKLC